MTYISNKGIVSVPNSTSTPLGSLGTFTGSWVDVSAFASFVVSAYSDLVGVLKVQFSVDQTNIDSTLSFQVAINTNEVHRITVTRQYARVVFENTTASAQTVLRVQALLGSQTALTSSLNSVVQQDADSSIVRPMDFNLLVGESKFQNHAITTKDGLNLDIDTGSVPEDITNEGGVYAGFPTGAVQAGEIVVAGADTGTVYYFYMATNTDTDYTFGTKAIAGAGTYALGHNIWRCNFAYFVSSSATAFNVGAITIRNTVTTTNVFCVIDAGFSQSYCSAYTVPFGSSVYIDRFNGNIRGATNGSLDGYIWYRGYQESPRLRFPFELQFGTLYFDEVDYLIRIPERTDIIPRIVTASANNLTAKFSYRILKVKTA